MNKSLLDLSLAPGVRLWQEKQLQMRTAASIQDACLPVRAQRATSALVSLTADGSMEEEAHEFRLGAQPPVCPVPDTQECRLKGSYGHDTLLDPNEPHRIPSHFTTEKTKPGPGQLSCLLKDTQSERPRTGRGRG